MDHVEIHHIDMRQYGLQLSIRKLRTNIQITERDITILLAVDGAAVDGAAVVVVGEAVEKKKKKTI